MTYFPTTASVVSAAALTDRILSKYRLPQPLSCQMLQRGLNDTYIVRAGRMTYFLRVYTHKWRKRSEIDAEIDMLRYLVRQKQPVSRPIKRKDGTYVNRISAPEGRRYAVLFTAATGNLPDFNKLVYCTQYGEICARLHACMDRRKPDNRRFHVDLKHLVDEPLKNIEPFLKERPQEFEYLKSVTAQLKNSIDALLPKDPSAYGFCHGDHHGGGDY